MSWPFSLNRFRLTFGIVFLLAALLAPLGGSAQTAASFVLTSAIWTCANPTVQTTWTAQGTVSSLHIRATNTSLDDAEATTVTNPSQSSHSLVLNRLDGIDKIAVTAYMSDGSVWEYYANAGQCDVAGTITGGMVDDGSDISIAITNATCSGFNWSVSSPNEVRVYVSVNDIIGQGMIPYIPQNGTQVSGSESYVVERENQTFFNIHIAVHDLVTTEQLATRSVPMNCPIFTAPSPTPDVTPSVTPDVDERTRVVIQIDMPGGVSVEGAPFSIYAPMAAQFAAEPYMQGIVGPNNTIVVFDLIEGQYRLVVEPAGMEPIDVVFSVGADQVTELMVVVDAVGNASVVPGQIAPTPTVAPADGKSPATSGESSSSAGVSTLPSTGSGGAHTATPMLLFALVTAFMGIVSLAVVRKSAMNRQVR